MTEAHPPADSPIRTWRAFLRAQLRLRNAVIVLLGISAFFAWREFTRPSFEETVAEIERLGGEVGREDRKIPLDFLPEFLEDAIGKIRLPPIALVELTKPDHAGNHAAILKLLPRFAQVSLLRIHNSEIRDADLAVLAQLDDLAVVDISSPNLRGSCLRYLRSHTKLKGLQIESAGLDESVTDAAAQIPKSVASLALSGPGVGDETVRKLAHLRNLQSLDLTNGRVTGSTLGELLGEKISALSLGDNPITDNSLDQIANWQSLNMLELDRTQITDAGIRKIAHLPKLEYLVLKETAVNGSGFDQPDGFQELRALMLTGAAVNDAGLEAMQPFPKVVNLNLGETRITDAGLPHLVRHSQLAFLDLPKTRITGAGFENAPIPHVFLLVLSGSSFTDENLSHLRNLPGLNEIFLNETGISDAGLEHFVDWRTLEKLDLSRTRVSTSGELFLKSMCPKLKIEFGSRVRLHLGYGNEEIAARIKELGGEVNMYQDQFPPFDSKTVTPAEFGTQVILKGKPDRTSEILPLLPELKDVRELLLQDVAATDEMLHVLESLPELRELVIEGCPVTGEFLSRLSGLKNLKKLWLRSSALDQSVAAGIPTLPDSLTDLELEGPGLDDKDLPHLARLKQLKRLLLVGNGLTWEGLPEVLARTQITDLDLTDAKLSDIAIRAIAATPRINDLNFFGASVTDQHLALLAEMPNLTWLGLATTQVTDAGLRHLARFPALGVLGCSETAVTGAGFDVVGGFPALWLLDLHKCQVTDDSLANMRSLPRLMALDLEGNKVTFRGLTEVSRQRKLRKLNLSRQPLGGEIPDFLRMEHVNQLTMQDCELQDDDLAFLSRFPNLEILSLGGNRITGSGFQGLTFPEMTYLDLSACDVTDAGFLKSGAFPKLETLHLNRCPITDAALDQVGKLEQLETLGIKGTAVSEARMDQLRSSRENLKVLFESP